MICLVEKCSFKVIKMIKGFCVGFQVRKPYSGDPAIHGENPCVSLVDMEGCPAKWSGDGRAAKVPSAQYELSIRALAFPPSLLDGSSKPECLIKNNLGCRLCGQKHWLWPLRRSCPASSNPRHKTPRGEETKFRSPRFKVVYIGKFLRDKTNSRALWFISESCTNT